MNITIRTIPHQDQRYDTTGDWWFLHNGDIEIRVSSVDNWRYEALVAVHELVEILLCKHQGISQERVDAFDMDFEKARPEGDNSEPGDDPMAPYYNEHQSATILERQLAKELGINWREYEERLRNLT